MTVPALFQPLTIRGVTFRNRIWLSPLCEYSAKEDGVPTDWHMVHLGSCAIGRAGLIMAEAAGINPAGRISPQDVGIWSDEQVAAWARIVAFSHSQGVAAGIQLGHAGRKGSTAPGWGVDYQNSTPLDKGGWQTVAPSALAYGRYDVPLALDAAGIDAVVTDWAAAARNAMTAGFDVVEIHAAHGYLVHQFLSPITNERTDEYGGSLENRARLVRRVVRAVREAVGDSVPVFVRLSATDWDERGITVDDVATVAGWVHEDGADLIDTSTGGIASGIPIPTGPGYQVEFAATIRRTAEMPTNAVGLITLPEQANEIVESGKADAVMLGREMMRDPHFALRASTALGYKLPYWPDQYLRAQP
ncbi:MAG: NADH:flavin oxidoreductase/NADH oxidase [Microbacteriaceae bacterium]|nr:NADH:flavin oxidoreductase/NADH oxidase [Microbacteriaceae bacterium]